MTHLTDHLTKLTCAAETARDLGCVHTVQALDRTIEEEKARLKITIQADAHHPLENYLVRTAVLSG